ncbi:MAG: DNA mismatch repair protein MutS, partial [Nitrosomonas sp.]
SYGLQVAALAGVPESVIKLAKKQLIRLEQENIARQSQMDLFAVPEPESEFTENKPHLDPVTAMLNELSPDELTPRQALEQLYALKKLLDSGR